MIGKLTTQIESIIQDVFMIGEGLIIWSSNKKSSIALSFIEAEYRGVVNATT